MTQPAYINGPSNFPTIKQPAFIAATGTTAKVIVEPQLEAGASGVQPPRYGGCTLLDLTVTSTDAAPKDVLLYMGKILTTQGVTPTGAITLTAQNKLSRLNNSWITDGWQVGDQVMVFTAFGTAQVVAAIDGIPGTVTAVTALDLTVNGTPWAVGSNVLTTGTRIVNTSQLFRATIAANSGNTAAIPNVSLLGNSMDSAVTRKELKLGSDGMLIAAMQAAVAALPAQVVLSPRIALY